MPPQTACAPIAMIVYNRPRHARRVFEFVRACAPPALFVIADGPRTGRDGDAQACAEARAVTEEVDWPCQVERVYAPTNLGCRRRVVSGLDRVFEAVESAIVVEDDCLPHATFGRFATELLERYRDDRRVMAVCGSNALGRWFPERHSYLFSRFGSVWGWASWRRAWELYDHDMSLWRDPWVRRTVRALCGAEFRAKEAGYAAAYAGEIDTWDYQWELARIAQGGLSVVPAVNLVTNIGFDRDATHTRTLASARAGREVQAIDFPLRAPPSFLPDVEFETRCLVEEGGPWLKRALPASAKRVLRRALRRAGLA